MPGPRKQSFAKPKNAKGTFRRILKYFKPYRGQLVLVLIGLLASVAANIAGTSAGIYNNNNSSQSIKYGTST